ncbi:alpha/beta hydrolase [Massilia sp. RP-1-19]|uniref:Alpha/beta hydrolase n=1 Tax=Massilia polaris TaxID=2728846 RepID=A0A848HLE2_9BURK|nr:alpha/beta hydrolase [Massilia polaris]NML61000.1 alpha/beta hydrolase [Massilia polaris]
MNETLPTRRRFLFSAAGVAGLALGAAPLAGAAPAKSGKYLKPPVRVLSNPQPLGPIKQVETDLLDIGYYEAGRPEEGRPVILLHGFPYDIHSFADVAPILAAQGYWVIIPHLRGHGSTRFLDAATPRSGQQAAIGQDVIDLMDALHIPEAVLGGYDWGGRAACVAALIKPSRVVGLVSVNSYLVQDIAKAALPLAPPVERGFWYQFYFTTERGRAGLTKNRDDIARLMWEGNSPSWRFDGPMFARSAKSFDNPDYVEVVIHSYRHRLGLAPGYPAYEALEKKLAAVPPISVPTITLDGEEDGVVAATDGTASAAKFSGKRIHRKVAGAGHNLPQEAPKAFADAIIELVRAGAWRT